MSQPIRRVLAAIALMAALLLAVPAPSHAAGFREPATLAMRVWAWLESLLLGTPEPAVDTRWEKEGSAIDPNGRTTPAPPPPASSTTSEEGSMIDPDG
jgi:hypothetical protein